MSPIDKAVVIRSFVSASDGAQERLGFALYWDFIARNERHFTSNPRMSLPLRNWNAKDRDLRAAIRRRASSLLERLRAGEGL